MWQELKKSKFFIFFSFAVMVLVIVFWAREVYQKYLIEKEISSLSSGITSLESKNSDLASLISYFKTREYKERQARTLLNLQKPGEFVVALPNPDTVASSGESVPQASAKESNLKLWYEYWFGK